MRSFSVFVRSLPQPKGSKQAFRQGNKMVVLESNRSQGAWARLVQGMASQEMEGPPMEGPLFLDLEFSLPRPASVKKRTWPHVRPDLDKLVRSVEDALTLAGVWRDDAQVVKIAASKRYGNEPGVKIRVEILG